MDMNARIRVAAVIAVVMMLGACSAPPPPPMGGGSGAAAPQQNQPLDQNQPPDQAVGLPVQGSDVAAEPTPIPAAYELLEHLGVDVHHLPIGDGRVSTTGV